MLGTQSDKQHVNLFRAEQIGSMITAKRLEEAAGVPAEDEYLKRTAKLGDLVRKMQRPWYAREVNPEGASDKAEKPQDNKAYTGLNQYMVGQQISSFKT